MPKPAVIDLKSRVVQSANLMVSELDGETVMMSLERGAYYGLDTTAQRIWELIAQPCRVSEVCDQLIAEYAVERATCEQQVCSFLNELRREGLVRALDKNET